MSIRTDISSLAPTAPLEFFEIDLEALGGGIVRFHAQTNELGVDVTWQGNVYAYRNVKASGFDMDGTGKLPRPKLEIQNLDGAITGFVLDYDQLRGAKVTRKRTLARYLDASNFTAGNPNADPAEQLPDEIYYIDRRSRDDGVTVEFELGASYDVLNSYIPADLIIDNLCPAIYKDVDTGCDWAPDPMSGPFFDESDAPATAANDKCSQLVSGCKCRFGATQPLSFMGFPAAGLIK